MQETEYTNLTLAFTTQSCFPVPKDVKLNSTHYLIVLQNIATNHSADVDYKDFMQVYRKSTKKPYSFWTIATTL